MEPGARRLYDQPYPYLVCTGATPEAARARWDDLVAEINADGYGFPASVRPRATEQPRLSQYSYGIYEPFEFEKQ
jgi:hypothetical protein